MVNFPWVWWHVTQIIWLRGVSRWCHMIYGRARNGTRVFVCNVEPQSHDGRLVGNRWANLSQWKQDMKRTFPFVSGSIWNKNKSGYSTLRCSWWCFSSPNRTTSPERQHSERTVSRPTHTGLHQPLCTGNTLQKCPNECTCKDMSLVLAYVSNVRWNLAVGAVRQFPLITFLETMLFTRCYSLDKPFTL